MIPCQSIFLLLSCSVVPDSLWPHGLQHTRPPCPSLFFGACSNSCPWRRWFHPTISSSVVPFSSCLQSFPSSGSFPMSQFFASHGQSIEALALASVLSMNIQGWFPFGLTGCISLQSKGPSRVFPNTTVQKHQFFGAQCSLWSNSSYPYMTTGETIALTGWVFVGKVMSLHFDNAISVGHSFSSKEHLLILWLQSPSTMILEPKKK